MPLELFAHHMSMVDQYSKVIEMLDADEETAKKLETSAWNREKCYFLMNLTMDDGSLLPLHIVDSDDLDHLFPLKMKAFSVARATCPAWMKWEISFTIA